jgi:hypothetical protein
MRQIAVGKEAEQQKQVIDICRGEEPAARFAKCLLVIHRVAQNVETFLSRIAERQ